MPKMAKTKISTRIGAMMIAGLPINSSTITVVDSIVVVCAARVVSRFSMVIDIVSRVVCMVGVLGDSDFWIE